MEAGKVMSARSTSIASRFIAYARRHVRLTTAMAVAGVAAAVGVALAISGVGQGPAHAAIAPTTNCSAVPSKCGFPDATNAGLPAGVTLKTVPAQVSSGSGWHTNANGSVEVTGNGAVLSGLSITGGLNITASNVTISNVKVVASGLYGISLRHTTGVTIQNSAVSGLNATSGRVSYAIDDVYGDSTGMTIKANNISAFRTAVAVSTGLVTGNYIHDPGYVANDHTNGIFDAGTTQPLTISNNTILNSLGQTDAISLDASSVGPVANKTVTGNLLAGGSYTIYGGASLGNVTSNMVIKNNNFSQAYFARSGYYGTGAYFSSTGTGNSWTGNTWDATGNTVPSP
jgi:hypothetical protein